VTLAIPVGHRCVGKGVHSESTRALLLLLLLLLRLWRLWWLRRLRLRLTQQPRRQACVPRPHTAPKTDARSLPVTLESALVERVSGGEIGSESVATGADVAFAPFQRVRVRVRGGLLETPRRVVPHLAALVDVVRVPVQRVVPIVDGAVLAEAFAATGVVAAMVPAVHNAVGSVGAGTVALVLLDGAAVLAWVVQIVDIEYVTERLGHRVIHVAKEIAVAAASPHAPAMPVERE